MPPKVPVLSPQEIRDRPRKAIKVGNDTYNYCYGGDKVACAHCGTVKFQFRINISNSNFEFELLIRNSISYLVPFAKSVNHPFGENAGYVKTHSFTKHIKAIILLLARTGPSLQILQKC